MTTTAVRLYGKGDLRLETFGLPPLKGGEKLARIISDSICMSSHKAVKQGSAHKRVPDDVANNPVIIGHEFCGELVETGEKFVVQPALNDPNNIHAAPGYSFPYIGGAATYVIIPEIVIERGCLLPYNGEAFYLGSLAEPMSCVIGGFNCMYRTAAGSYVHDMGIKPGGRMALLAGAGPMGLGAIDYALHAERRPSLLVVTDINQTRLARAAGLYTPEHARGYGVELRYQEKLGAEDTGFDDVFVYAPVAALVEQAGAVLGANGCLNFFAGPEDPEFSARLNFYDLHYNARHIACNSGGNTEDMKKALELTAKGQIDPSPMITHVGGLDAVIDTTLHLPDIPGGKKLIYTQISMPLTAIDGAWTPEREKRLLESGILT